MPGTSGHTRQRAQPAEGHDNAEILDLLKASAEPISPAQIAKALGKNGATIRNILAKMAHAGEVKMKTFGKYTPVDNVDNVDSSSFKEREMQDLPILDENESATTARASTLSTLSMGVQADDPEADEDEDEGDCMPPPEFSARWRDDPA